MRGVAGEGNSALSSVWLGREAGPCAAVAGVLTDAPMSRPRLAWATLCTRAQQRPGGPCPPHSSAASVTSRQGEQQGEGSPGPRPQPQRAKHLQGLSPWSPKRRLHPALCTLHPGRQRKSAHFRGSGGGSRRPTWDDDMLWRAQHQGPDAKGAADAGLEARRTCTLNDREGLASTRALGWALLQGSHTAFCSDSDGPCPALHLTGRRRGLGPLVACPGLQHEGQEASELEACTRATHQGHPLTRN